MKFIQITSIIYFVFCINCIICKNSYHNNSYNQLRNTVLRFSLLKNNNNIYGITFKEKIKIKKTEIKNYILSKMYDINTEYTSLSEDDRFIIDIILGCIF